MGEIDLNDFIDATNNPNEMADVIGNVTSTDEGYSPAQGSEPDPPEKEEGAFSSLPGSLVLPPIPPLGTDKGKNPTPLPIQKPRREEEPVVAAAKPGPQKHLVVVEYEYEAPAPATPEGATAPPVPHRVHSVRPVWQKGQEAQPAPVLPRTMPAALSVGSTSARGTISVPVMKVQRLPLGSVTDQVNPPAQPQVKPVFSNYATPKAGVHRMGQPVVPVNTRVLPPGDRPVSPSRALVRAPRSARWKWGDHLPPSPNNICGRFPGAAKPAGRPVVRRGC